MVTIGSYLPVSPPTTSSTWAAFRLKKYLDVGECQVHVSPDLVSLELGTGTDPMVAIMARIPMLGLGGEGPSRGPRNI